MSFDEEYVETIQELIDLFDREIGKHYDDNFIAGLERAKEIIKEYFELIE
jgi:hypothetical protein